MLYNDEGRRKVQNGNKEDMESFGLSQRNR